MGAMHTPGPWKVYKAVSVHPVLDDGVERNAHTVICDCLGPDAAFNAHLIAAAPELLAACEAWVTYLDSDDELGSFDDEEAMMAAFRAAIAKARGQ